MSSPPPCDEFPDTSDATVSPSRDEFLDTSDATVSTLLWLLDVVGVLDGRSRAEATNSGKFSEGLDFGEAIAQVRLKMAIGG